MRWWGDWVSKWGGWAERLGLGTNGAGGRRERRWDAGGTAGTEWAKKLDKKPDSWVGGRTWRLNKKPREGDWDWESVGGRSDCRLILGSEREKMKSHEEGELGMSGQGN